MSDNLKEYEKALMILLTKTDISSNKLIENQKINGYSEKATLIPGVNSIKNGTDSLTLVRMT